jgi:hypothetical protein
MARLITFRKVVVLFLLAGLFLSCLVALVLIARSFHSGADLALVASLAVMSGGSFYGLLRRHVWGRWLGLAVGIAGLLTAAEGMLIADDLDRGPFLLLGTGFGVLLLCLVGGEMARQYDLPLSLRSAWTARGDEARGLSWTPTLSLASLPFLVFLAFSDKDRSVFCTIWIFQIGACAAAACVVLGVLLLLRGRILGSLLLTGAALSVGSLAVAIWLPWGEAASSISHRAPCYSRDAIVMFTIHSAPAIASGVLTLAALGRLLGR